MSAPTGSDANVGIFSIEELGKSISLGVNSTTLVPLFFTAKVPEVMFNSVCGIPESDPDILDAFLANVILPDSGIILIILAIIL